MGLSLKPLVGLAGRAVDYLTPGVGSNRVTDWAGWGDKPSSSVAAPKINTAPSYTPDNTSALLSQNQAQYDALAAQTRNLMAQLAAQPKLPSFNYGASMASAQATAANTVNPVYQDKLNQYLAKAQATLGQKTTDVTRKKEDIATALAQALQDSELGRQRATEDNTNAMGDITANENSWQRQEGRQFDTARTGLLVDTANKGLTESGLGQGVVDSAVTDRNLASADQVRGFDNQKRDTETLFNRKLSDINTSDERSRGSAQRSTQDQEIDLNNFIQNANLDEQSFRANNELDRIDAINNATQSAYQQIVAQAIQALSGSGARPQDIALFKQVYG